MNPFPDLDAAAAAFDEPPVTRFAPSPTGSLHLGHVAHAIYVWGVARALGGRILLRVEDHDRMRSRPIFEGAILEDLDWLGFVPDAGAGPLRRQSDQPHLYDAALTRLRRAHHVYACECSRAAIGGERYSGRCRQRGLAEGPGVGLRVQLESRVERFHDLLLGAVEQRPDEQVGDILLRDRRGQWTYQFAVTVDDAEQQVTLVIRGADLLSSTGRQIQLARMLGRGIPPRFLHHPLILRPDGAKLSKRRGDPGVRELRERGLSAPEVIGQAAAAAGLLASAAPLAVSELPELLRRGPRHQRQ